MDQIILTELCEKYTINLEDGTFTRKFKFRHLQAGSLAGSMRNDGYLILMVNKKSYYLHRLIWLAAYGYWPNEIDHIDRNRANNAISNLREVTHTQNQRNRSMFKNNKSGYVGVHWNVGNKKWLAQKNGKHIGYFDTAQDASIAYHLAN